MKKRNWELFFQEEAPRYLKNEFTQNTLFEVQFIKKELNLKKGDRILDIGCGTGRHSLELAKDRYQITGIDLSTDQLNIAKEKAAEMNLDIRFIKADASQFRLDETFEHAIRLCEGAFCLFEEGFEPFSYHQRILRNGNRMLRVGGRFILNALNGFRFIRQCSDDNVLQGKFDPMTVSTIETVKLKNGEEIRIMEKGFLPHELKMMLETCGFEVLHLWGGTAGMWNKEPLKLDEMEIMIISQKVFKSNNQVENNILS